MAISLAPVRYNKVFQKYGGPIERLEMSTRVSSDGKRRHCASGYLSASLRPSWYQEMRLYGNADGGGTHLIRNTAGYIAISESLERWAFYSECEGARGKEFGFDWEPSTTGMAAFPGLTNGGARARAADEAVERWSIVEWWLGRLPSRLISDDGGTEGALEIISPLPRCSVAIVWRACSFGGLAFGFAGGATLKEALQRARIEQDRNISVLETLVRETGQRPDASAMDKSIAEAERRLVFFASEAGKELFRARMAQSRELAALPPAPRKLIDREIPGPWTHYASVWRTLYEPTSYAYLDEDIHDFFLF